MHLVNIEKAEYKGEFKIFLEFDDGKKGIVDLENFLQTNRLTVFKRICDIKEFQKFSLNHDTIVWGEDLDLAPEFLHDLLIKQNEK